MSEAVFILGAGASRAAGAPLMGDFLDIAYRLWKGGHAKGVEEHYERVFAGISALQAVHSKARLDIDNIESVFATFETAAMLGKFPGTEPAEVAAMVESLKLLIGNTIEMTLDVPWQQRRALAPPPYGEFGQLLVDLLRDTNPHRAVSVLTFNYDLACDLALHLGNIPVDYCLGESVRRSAIPLLKLHGSLNWVYCPDLSRVVPWTVPQHLSRYQWHVFEEVGTVKLRMMPHLKDFKYEDHDVVDEPVLVPPTWNKADYHGNLADVWGRAATELAEAEDIFIIGYSLPETDAFFRYLFALGTAGSVLLKRLWVFNPDSSVEERFRMMLGPAAVSRFRFFDLTFADALDVIREQCNERGG